MALSSVSPSFGRMAGLGMGAVFLLGVIWLPFWTLRQELISHVTLPTPADVAFQFSTDIDNWPNWRPGLREVRHKDGEGFQADLVLEREVETFAFDLDSSNRIMTWRSRDEAFRLQVFRHGARGSTVFLSRQRTFRTLSGWLWESSTPQQGEPRATLAALASLCSEQQCATEAEASDATEEHAEALEGSAF